MPEKIITICPRCQQPVDPADPLSITSRGDGNHTGNTYHSYCTTAVPVDDQVTLEILRDSRGPERIRSVRSVERRQRIRTPAAAAAAQDHGRKKPSWRVYCKDCKQDISEPLDRRAAKKFMREHRENQGHDAILVREGLF